MIKCFYKVGPSHPLLKTTNILIFLGAKSPRTLQVSTSVTYSVGCSNEIQISTALTQSLNELQCVQNKTCTAAAVTSGCGDSRRKRSTSSLNAVVQLYTELSQNALNLDTFYSNNIGNIVGVVLI